MLLSMLAQMVFWTYISQSGAKAQIYIKQKRVLNKFHAVEINQKKTRNLFLSLHYDIRLKFLFLFLQFVMFRTFFFSRMKCTLTKRLWQEIHHFNPTITVFSLTFTVSTLSLESSNCSSFLFVAIFASFNKNVLEKAEACWEVQLLQDSLHVCMFASVFLL